MSPGFNPATLASSSLYLFILRLRFGANVKPTVSVVVALEAGAGDSVVALLVLLVLMMLGVVLLALVLVMLVLLLGVLIVLVVLMMLVLMLVVRVIVLMMPV